MNAVPKFRLIDDEQPTPAESEPPIIPQDYSPEVLPELDKLEDLARFVAQHASGLRNASQMIVRDHRLTLEALETEFYTLENERAQAIDEINRSYNAKQDRNHVMRQTIQKMILFYTTDQQQQPAVLEPPRRRLGVFGR